MSDKLPPIEELLTEFDSGKVPRSQTWHTLITGLYLNLDSVNEIEGWYNTVQELTGHNQELANTISDNHQQIEVWYGQIDSWQQQVEANKVSTSQSATMATAQATMARAWAANPEDALVDGKQYSSLHYASKSSEYADASSGNAELSRDQSMLAQQAMRNASNSEINANLSKVQAQQAATEAGQSKEASGVSEQKAADSAAAAKNSETAAVGAADSALDSKNSAAGSARTATQQADRSESEADRSEAAADHLNREGIPIGSILPYYGSSAPMGWLALSKGAKISNADYPALYQHLTDQRKPKAASGPATFHNNFTLCSPTNKQLYVYYNGNVSRLEPQFSEGENFRCSLNHIKGVIPTTATIDSIDLYNSLIDIPLPNEECFLPDGSGNFIKGYDPTGTREMGTFEQDAIRNITGGFTEFYGGVSLHGFSGAMVSKGQINGAVGSNVNVDKSIGVNIDASKVVPTGFENTPKNLNCLWIIKAYDAVNNPEQLQAKVVVDQVNSNTSEILTVNGTMSQFGYELLDFGSVTKNSRYVKANPFGNNTPVIVRADIYLNDQWSDASFLFSSTGMAGANYNEGEGIVLQTGGSEVSVNSNNTGDGDNYSFTKGIISVPCRVHVWRVKG